MAKKVKKKPARRKKAAAKKKPAKKKAARRKAPAKRKAVKKKATKRKSTARKRASKKKRFEISLYSARTLSIDGETDRVSVSSVSMGKFSSQELTNTNSEISTKSVRVGV